MPDYDDDTCTLTAEQIEADHRAYRERERMTPWWRRLWDRLPWQPPLIHLNPQARALKAILAEWGKPEDGTRPNPFRRDKPAE